MLIDAQELMTPEGRVAWIMPYLPDPGPLHFKLIMRTIDGNHYVREDRLSVIMSGAREQDGKRWLHLSLARPNRMPSWEEFRDAGRLFLPEECWAYQVVPPRARYINKHPYCLHMFACVEGPQLPDFTRGGNSL